MYTTTPNPSNDITARGMKDSHNENIQVIDHEGSSKSTIIPQQRLQHTQNPLPSLQTLPSEFQKIFSTCYEIKRTCSDMAKLYGTDDPNITKLYTQITQLEGLLLGQDSHPVQTPSPSLNNSTNNVYSQQTATGSPSTQSNHVSSTFSNCPATATVVNITNYQYNQQVTPGMVPLNSVPEAATQNQFGHASANPAIPVGVHSSYGTYRQSNSFPTSNATNAAVASIVAIGIPSSTPPTPPNSYIDKSDLLDSDSDPDNSPVGSKKRRGYGQPGFPLIQDKGRGRRQRAKAAPPLVGEDQLYCRACGETQTCEWRRGPDGYKSLCNACGIHYAKIVKKEETAAQEYKPKSVGLSMLLNND